MTARLVLIDRDGVINVEKQTGYVESPQELRIYPQALEALALLKRKGFTCVIVTNQSVVGRGKITQGGLDEIHAYLCGQALSHGGEIAAIYACVDHPDRPTERRKPGSLMLVEAITRYDAIPDITPMIGDAVTDMQAAFGAGCARYLVMTGKGKATAASLPEYLYPVTLCEDILDAANKIAEAYP